MNRLVKKISVAEGTLYRVTIESNLCEINTYEYSYYKMELLRTLADNPTFCSHGNGDFQKAVMFYDGEKWVLETETINST